MTPDTRQSAPRASPPDAVWRLFVAIPVAAPVKAALRAAADPFRRDCPGVAWVRPDAMHLTLVFIGDTFAARAPAFSRAMDEAVRTTPPFVIRFNGWGRFGHPRSPRVVWAGVGTSGNILHELQSRVATALRHAGALFDDRPFTPHVTLARIRSRSEARPLLEFVDKCDPPPIFGEQDVDRIELIQSTLTSVGARYETRHTARLADSPRV